MAVQAFINKKYQCLPCRKAYKICATRSYKGNSRTHASDIKEPRGFSMPPVTLPVVVWGSRDKRADSCSVSIDTTFQDVIDELMLGNIKSALVGHLTRPFGLMPGDFDPDDDYDPHHKNTCLADTFTGKVVDIVFWMEYIGEGSIAKGKEILKSNKERFQERLLRCWPGTRSICSRTTTAKTALTVRKVSSLKGTLQPRPLNPACGCDWNRNLSGETGECFQDFTVGHTRWDSSPRCVPRNS